MVKSSKRTIRLKVFIPGLIFGSIVDAFGYALFLIPNKLTLGGVAGIAIIIHHLWGFPVGLTYFILNIPIFFWAFKKLGKASVWSTFLSIAINALFIDLFAFLFHDYGMTNDIFLAAIYGAALSGLGIGITFRSRASLGGTDLLAQIIHNYTHIPFGQIVMMIDALVVVSAAIIFRNAELALFPLLGLFILGKVIDVVQEGFSRSKAAIIVTSKENEIRKFILEDIGRGVTVLEGRGGYTQEGKSVLMCAFAQKQVSFFKNHLKLIDPNAFIIIGTTDEVVGEGFEKRF
jgi:uncharacterized membrane-anchored protein YitT (DUF2179 family)